MAFRGFIAVDLPRLDSLVLLLEDLRRAGGALKVVDPANVHLTLKFLGETEEALVPKIVEVMRSCVAGRAPFVVRIVGTGAFPNLRRMNVLWVGTAGAQSLVDIAYRLEMGVEPLGYPKEVRAFSPHATIARVKKQRDADAVRQVLEAHAQDAFGEFVVDHLRLKKSVLTPSGPLYSTVGEVAL